MIILVLLYLFTGLCIAHALRREIVEKGWTIFVYTTFYLLLFYVVVPIISLLFFNDRGIKVEGIAYVLPDQTHYEIIFFTYLCISVGFVFFFLGYRQLMKLTPRKLERRKRTNLMIFLILGLSLISLFFYIKGFGSLNRAIENANLVRSGFYKDVEEGDTVHTFFFRFIFLAIIPFLYFHYGDHYSRIVKWSAFVVSLLVLVILYGFLSAGRQSIIDLILIFLLTDLIKKKQFLNFKIIAFGILAFLLLPVLDSFFLRKPISTATAPPSVSALFVNEFGFPYFSLNYAIQEDYSFFYFSDFLSGIFGRILPSSWNPGIVSSNYLNSQYMLGRDVKSIPPGILAQGYYSFGVIGVIVISFFTGLFFKFLDVIFSQVAILNNEYTYLYAYFITSAMVWVRTGLPANYFYNLTFIAFLVFFFYGFKIQYGKQNE